ncbi:MAG: hypothetical protein U9N45_08125, partial [Gemmatimonadota bacterium]|nr:hypothetical protein [Gemmatimonadota bacterium]
ANVLKRTRRPFFFVCGRKDDRKALKEIRSWAEAAQVKKRLKRSIIGIAGYTFDGMGDFGLDTTLLNTALGPEVKHLSLSFLSDTIKGVGDLEVEKETELDREKYTICKTLDPRLHKTSNRVYIGLRKVVEELSLNAFTMHFQGILENPGIETVPFLAISKLQEQGLAYAGEGDLIGAAANLMMRYLCGDTLFTETFCPDFDGGKLVMGHMGESNPAFGVETVLRQKKFIYGKTVDPVVAHVNMRGGEKATVLNLGLVEDNKFQITVYTGEVCEKIKSAGDIDMPYFHFKPDIELTRFLTMYGQAGGTHHLAMAPGDRKDEILKLAGMLEINTVVLE